MRNFTWLLVLALFSFLAPGPTWAASNPWPLTPPAPPANSPVLPSADVSKTANFDKLTQKQCTDFSLMGSPAHTCMTPIPCPSHPVDDRFHFTAAESLCFYIDGDVTEFYAPTPSSDAVRAAHHDLARVQLPKAWIRDGKFDGSIKADIDAGYWGAWQDRITGKFIFGMGLPSTLSNLYEGIIGPFGYGYLNNYGLNKDEVVHTKIEMNNRNGKDTASYTLYTVLGDAIRKDAPNYLHFNSSNSDFSNDLNTYKFLDGYIIRGVQFYCISQNDAYTSCKGILSLGTYAEYLFNIEFSKPTDHSKILVYINHLNWRVIPAMLNNGTDPVVPPKSFGSGSDNPPDYCP